MGLKLWLVALLCALMLLPADLPSVWQPHPSRAVVMARETMKTYTGQPVPRATPWRWQNPLPHGNTISALACPDSRTCYAVGSVTIMVSHDGGQTWRTTYDKQNGLLQSLSCPNSVTCYAIGYLGGAGNTIIGTVDGGQTWRRLRTGQEPPLNDITCPTRTVCYASGPYADALLTTRDGGQTWSSRTLTWKVVSLSCPGVDVCYGPLDTALVTSPPPSVAVTTDGGATWLIHPVGIAKRSGAQLGSVACVSATICSVIAYGGVVDVPFIVRTNDGGRSWVQRPFPANTFFRAGSLTCPTALVCFLAGDNGTLRSVLLSTIDGGRTWTRRQPLPANPMTIGCAGPSHCIAAGPAGTVVRTSDGWATRVKETRNAVPGPVTSVYFALHALACPSRTVCYAVGDSQSVVKMTNGNGRWSAVPRPRVSAPLTMLACPGVMICYAGTEHRGVVSTRNGGRTWSSVLEPGMSAVACPSSSVCYAGGHRGAMQVTHNGGRTWIKEHTPLTGRNYLVQQIRCPTTSICYVAAIGPSEPPPHPTGNIGAIVSTRDSGRTWSHTNTDPSPFSLACRSAVDCVALVWPFSDTPASPALLTHDGGRTWQKRGVLPAGAWRDITCATRTTCYLVGLSGAVEITLDGGQTWRRQETPTLNMVNAVRCVAPTSCYAVGQYGTILSTT